MLYTIQIREPELRDVESSSAVLVRHPETDEPLKWRVQMTIRLWGLGDTPPRALGLDKLTVSFLMPLGVGEPDASQKLYKMIEQMTKSGWV